LVPHWRQGSTILKQCEFLVAERTDTAWLKIPASLRRQSRQIPWPSVPLASHDIRRLVQRGKSIRYQVPDAVERYMKNHRLYRCPRPRFCIAEGEPIPQDTRGI